MKRGRTSRHKQHGIMVTRLIARDGAMCKLCGSPIDRTIHEGPMSVTIDHRLPLAHGGTDVFSNLQLAHDHCNSERGSEW